MRIAGLPRFSPGIEYNRNKSKSPLQSRETQGIRLVLDTFPATGIATSPIFASSIFQLPVTMTPCFWRTFRSNLESGIFQSQMTRPPSANLQSVWVQRSAREGSSGN